MTNMNATSASGRYEAARRILADYGDTTATPDDPGAVAQLTLALRTLTEPPVTAEDPEQIANASLRWFNEQFGRTVASIEGFGTARQIAAMVEHAVRAGIQAAWDSWEPESAPTSSDDRIYKVGEADDTPIYGPCCRGTHGDWGCTRTPGHGGNHAAGTGDEIAEVWD